MDSANLISLLTTLGYSLPELLGCGIALALLLGWSRPGPGRRLGAIGLGLMLCSVLLRMLLSLYQTWYAQMQMSTGSMESLGRFYGITSIAHLALNLVGVAGLLMLAWGFCKANPRDA